jgi:hypothetical protein
VKRQEPIWVIGGDDLIRIVKEENLPVKRMFSADDFHITTLTIPFLNRDTRAEATSKVYLLQF